MTNLAGLSRLSACFASKRAMSHKCHIWCRLHGNTRCNQPLELDRSCTEVGNGARALLVGMCRWQSNSDPSVNSRLNNLIKILPEFALIERNQQVVMKRSVRIPGDGDQRFPNDRDRDSWMIVISVPTEGDQ